MNDKYTALCQLAPEELQEVPVDAHAVTISADGRMHEYRAGRVIPRESGMAIYIVPDVPLETLFAVHGAIDCRKPDGELFQPGFCFTFKLRYASPSGLQALLQAYRRSRGRMPECITLEVFYDLLAKEISAVCKEAARKFSGGQTLPYVHWWQEFSHGTAMRDALFVPLMQAMYKYGFRLEPDSLRLAGLAGVPAL